MMEYVDKLHGVVLAERGRKKHGTSVTEVFFEVAALPDAPVSQLVVFALRHDGTIIGSGSAHAYPQFGIGQVFGVKFDVAQSFEIAGWLTQTESNTDSSVRALFRAAKQGETAASDSRRDRATFPSFSIKRGYASEVHAHKRTRVFHHPECSNAKSMHDLNRVVLSSPSEALQSQFLPCFACMLDFGG